MNRYAILLVVFAGLFLMPYFPGIVGISGGRNLLLYWLALAGIVILFGIFITTFRWERNDHEEEGQ